MTRFTSRFPLLLAAVLTAATFLSLPRASADPADDLFTLGPDRLVPADRHERPVFLWVAAPWSRVARRFESEVLARPDVRAFLTAEFVCARLDAPVPDDLARRYDLERLPACVFLDRFGARLRTVPGERSAADFLALARQALPELVEQAADTEAALRLDAPDAAELARRARVLVDGGLAARAIPHLERLVELDPADEQYAGLWAMAERARLAFRAGDVDAGDRWTARVAALDTGAEPLYATDLGRERLHALRSAARWDEAALALERFRDGDLSDDERENLDLEEARLLRAQGRETEGIAKLQDLWDTARGPAFAAAEAELEGWAATAGAAANGFRAIRDGRALVRRFDCAECHGIEPAVAVPMPASCVACHQQIRASASNPKEMAEGLRADPEWYSHVRNVRHYLYAPHLATAGARLRREWLRDFLRHPVDVRPFLPESMPRLPLTDADVEVALDYLDALAARRVVASPAEALPDGDVARGERLFVEKGCSACHLFGNRTFPEGPPAQPWPRDTADTVRNAPNLRWARDRVRPETLALWIREPARFVPGTLMPANKLPPQEIADLAAFLLRGDLGPAAPLSPPRTAADLPGPRPGPVRFEAAADVFLDTCKHCHLPDAEGGIGNSGGGWGYLPRGLELATPTGPLRGSFAPGGRRRSIVAPGPGEALSPLLQRLLWRMDENRFDAWPPYQDPLIAVPRERHAHPPGMPLGLPALTAEEIATLRAWAEQAATASEK